MVVRFFSKRSVGLILLIGVFAAVIAISGVAQKQFTAKEEPVARNGPLFDVRIVSFGPSQRELDALNNSLPQHAAVAALLTGVHYRHLYTELIEPDAKRETRSVAPTRFRAIFYDYSHQRTIVADGLLAAPATLTAHIEPGWQPSPSQEEFQDAVKVLGTDPLYGPALSAGGIRTYRPLPPVEEFAGDFNAAPHRIINVGLMAKKESKFLGHEIVGVDLALQRVVRHPKGGRRQTPSLTTACGVLDANQTTTPRGTAGQYQLTVTDAGTTLWEMLVIRPSISSGTLASAIELRDVKYRGRSVLKRGHVPILNVQYLDDACGPYRDWQYQEGMFQATGADIAPGIRDCGTTPATTAAETGSDSGNFRGVAIYRQGTEVVLVTELEAGWYRYIHEWRFDANGTIRPRFGFGATGNFCTCETHTHHVYFRFDFDIDGPINSIYELPNKTGWSSQPDYRLPDYLIGSEKKVVRNPEQLRRYRIRGGDRSYLFYPGSNDGVADTYARGDMWFLRYKTGATNLQAEIDDGHGTSGGQTEADLDQFLSNESLAEQDSVIWYHASSLHTAENDSVDTIPTSDQGRQPHILSGDRVVGPDLFPDDW
jgi:hypothetical protein